jgi:TetR/AcrR family transcriptional regulator, transcriptional repressor of bet genes
VSPRKRKTHSAAARPRARSAHNRQRQRLIEACISALHIHGPSRTTVERVVAIAKMSPGIVRFYFDSKAAMLVASLQFLSAEFEEQVLVPVSKLKANPVAALELLVDLYLDPEIASPRKVSVWYAFWGEASSRQEYYDICGQKDENFAALVHELIEHLIRDTGQAHLDPGGVALGLIGALEMLWQDFAFRSEGDIDRAAAKRRCMAYLKSVFPGRFSMPTPTIGATAHSRGPLPGWAYGGERAASLERESVFRSAWSIVAHESQLAQGGDFLTADLGAERALVVRDASGTLHALRNSCPELPHALVTERSGRLDNAIACHAHRLSFGLDGRRRSGAGPALGLLELRESGGFVIVGPPQAGRCAPELVLPDQAQGALRALGVAREIEVAANWKLVVEQWVAAAPATVRVDVDALTWTLAPLKAASTPSAACYRSLGGSTGDWTQRLLAPNQLLQRRPEGFSVIQAIPATPTHCRVRRLDFALGSVDQRTQARAYLADRLTPWTRRSALALAESAQRAVVASGYRAAADQPVAPALAWFWHYLAARVPAFADERPPSAE